MISSVELKMSYKFSPKCKPQMTYKLGISFKVICFGISWSITISLMYKSTIFVASGIFLHGTKASFQGNDQLPP
jgi:hypothetical protein